MKKRVEGKMRDLLAPEEETEVPPMEEEVVVMGTMRLEEPGEGNTRARNSAGDGTKGLCDF